MEQACTTKHLPGLLFGLLFPSSSQTLQGSNLAEWWFSISLFCIKQQDIQSHFNFQLHEHFWISNKN